MQPVEFTFNFLNILIFLYKVCRTGTLRKLKVNLDKRIKIRNLDVLTCREKFRLRWKEYQILFAACRQITRTGYPNGNYRKYLKGTYCSDSTINQTIKSIRQKISDGEHTLIRTIPRLGYKVENQAVFHFISEDEDYADDDILNDGMILALIFKRNFPKTKVNRLKSTRENR